MNSDNVWQIIRYGLIALGGFITNKGLVSSDQWITIVGAIGTIFPIVWGLYVKAGTTAVPDATAARKDVPTVSGITGAISPATSPAPSPISQVSAPDKV